MRRKRTLRMVLIAVAVALVVAAAGFLAWTCVAG
jgi:VIT1/CCC1 family predicted Fe2+/Mn2+ transporter